MIEIFGFSSFEKKIVDYMNDALLTTTLKDHHTGGALKIVLPSINIISSGEKIHINVLLA